MKIILMFAMASALSGAELNTAKAVSSANTSASQVSSQSSPDSIARGKRPKRPPVPDPDHGPTLPPDPWTPI